jgi:hypothetical protein
MKFCFIMSFTDEVVKFHTSSQYSGVSVPLSSLPHQLLILLGAHNWLRHYATSPKVAVSIPDRIIEFFD